MIDWLYDSYDCFISGSWLRFFRCKHVSEGVKMSTHTEISRLETQGVVRLDSKGLLKRLINFVSVYFALLRSKLLENTNIVIKIKPETKKRSVCAKKNNLGNGKGCLCLLLGVF